MDGDTYENDEDDYSEALRNDRELGRSERRRMRRHGGSTQSPSPSGGGIDRAILDTPRGSATLRFPEKVASYAELQATQDRLEDALSSVRAAVSRVRKEQGSQGTMGLITTLLAQQQASRDLTGHTHTVVDPSTKTSIPTSEARVPSGAGTLSSLLPLLLMSSGSGRDDDRDGGGMSSTLLLLLATGALGGGR